MPRGGARPNTGGARPGAGRKPFQATRVQRQDVRVLKAGGWSDERIARALGIPKSTLQKHFRVEISEGADIEVRFALRLLRRQANRGNVSAIKEYLKFTLAGTAVGQMLDEPAPARQAKPGKKEIAREAAMRAGAESDWGEDLKPVLRVVT